MEGSSPTPTLVESRPAAGARAVPISGGSAIGRFIVLNRLGAGGMGVVYAAYDPELDRKVALKLLHADEAGSQSSVGRSRMVREAQALAQLGHPNVVAVFDVGTFDQRVWLAMEFVDGDTLDQWKRSRNPDWREIVEVFDQAAMGLAAAHAKGIVHRDFKPANVMVSSEGRVRVMDFGLARTGPASTVKVAAELPESLPENLTPSEPALREPLTKAGRVLGTPAYMAPEQFLADAVDGRSDQFSFCVAFWEALFDQRPFSGDRTETLANAVLQGDRKPAPRSRVPSWVRAVIDRGLDCDPDKRWPSMDALRQGLRAGAARRRKLVVAGVALGTLAVAGGLEGARRVSVASAVAACEERGRAMHDTWNDAARARIENALIATGIDYAPAAFDHLVPHVDRFVETWESAATQTCIRAEVEETMRPEAAARARECLDDARWALDELIEVLGDGGRETVQRAVPMGAGLPRADLCRDEDRLAVRVPSPTEPAAREAVAEVRRALQRARSLRAAGRFDNAHALVGELATRCEAIDWPPVCAEVQVELGGLAVEVGKLEDAEALLERGFLMAAEAGAAPTMSAAAGSLTVVVGSALGRPDDGIRWGKMALSLASGTGLGDALPGARIRGALGGVYHDKGSLDDALALEQEGLAIEERILGPRHPRVAESTLNIGIIHYDRGDYDEALTWQTRALAIFEETLGADHPDVARCLNNLAVLHYALEQPDRTRELLERALEVRERSLGPDHPDVAGTLTNLANLRQIEHDYDGALRLLARAAKIYGSVLGPDHPLSATVEANTAQAHASLGNYAEAEPLLVHALSVYERTFGTEHAEVARTHLKLGELHESAGDPAAAAAAFKRADAGFTATLGEDHPETRAAREGLARVQ